MNLFLTMTLILPRNVSRAGPGAVAAKALVTRMISRWQPGRAIGREGRRVVFGGHGKWGENAGTTEPSSSFPAFCLRLSAGLGRNHSDVQYELSRRLMIVENANRKSDKYQVTIGLSVVSAVLSNREPRVSRECSRIGLS